MGSANHRIDPNFDTYWQLLIHPVVKGAQDLLLLNESLDIDDLILLNQLFDVRVREFQLFLIVNPDLVVKKVLLLL